MASQLEVLFAPAEFDALSERDLSQTVCVVFDVLRATSTMMTALVHGAREIIPVAEIADALALYQSRPDVLLAGERDGVRILARQSGGPDFHLGNSPREFTEAVVRNKTIVMTTTNGTRALKACAHAQKILIGSFLGLAAVGQWLRRRGPANLLVVCAGTINETSYEDTLAAGALCQLTEPLFEPDSISDSAAIARQIYQDAAGDLLAAIPRARNARRLLNRPELRDDVPFCLQRDTLPFLAHMSSDGVVRKLDGTGA